MPYNLGQTPGKTLKLAEYMGFKTGRWVTPALVLVDIIALEAFAPLVLASAAK